MRKYIAYKEFYKMLEFGQNLAKEDVTSWRRHYPLWAFGRACGGGIF
jgi:hypothetical protein